MKNGKWLAAVGLVCLICMSTLLLNGCLYNREDIDMAYEEGFQHGRICGFDDGHYQGYEEGYNDGYSEGYDAGLEARSDVPPSPLSGVTAICNDGTYSYSKHRSGTCSHHGGVREWINRPPS